jgi:hypothetical protein
VHTVVPVAEPEPLFTEPTKLRVRCHILIGVHVYDKGHEFVAPAETASWLVAENHAEVVK